MQTIYLDISNKGVYPCVYAKQGDVGRKLLLIVTDAGIPYPCDDRAISVWYNGSSGEGNYTHIGEESAIVVDGNKITIELIQKMLSNVGAGVLSVSINAVDGSQIGLWNIEYCVEEKPGAESEEAKQHYDAFSKTAGDLALAAKTFTPDKTLTKSGAPADASETGRQISVERARIDQLKTLPNGSTTGDAELLDIRIGADGFPYESAGEAVRSQIADLNGAVFSTATDEKTLHLEDCNVIEGKFVYYDSANQSGNELYSYARFIPVAGYARMEYTRIQVVSGQTHAGLQFVGGDVDNDGLADYQGGEQRAIGTEVAYIISDIAIPEGADAVNVSIRNDLDGWYVKLYNPSAKHSKIADNTQAIEENAKAIAENKEALDALVGNAPGSKIVFSIGSKVVSNASIRCAKERTFTDGTAPAVEYYVVEDTDTHKFYRTRNFNTFEYLFTFDVTRDDGDQIQTPFKYKFGVTQNDDIIAVFRTEALADITTHSDDVRENPFVFIASENYKKYEVDFGDLLKPSGWLSNVGYNVLPSGEVLFCEYTRPSVATANVWKLTGDIKDAGNWVVTKSFELSGDTSAGFKHCHAIMHDPYTNVVYATTGDDNVGASVWYSTDNGDTWTQITIADSNFNEKYFRILNYTFLEDYVYWSTDSGKAAYHYIFKAPRNADGVIDYSNVVDLVHLPTVETTPNYATYGTAYIPELDMILLIEKSDSNTALEAPVRGYIISKNELVTLGTIKAVEGRTVFLGFRTEYTEYYPKDGIVRFGFGAVYTKGDYRNGIKGFGNPARPSSINTNVNNLYLKPYCVDGEYKFVLGTCI